MEVKPAVDLNSTWSSYQVRPQPAPSQEHRGPESLRLPDRYGVDCIKVLFQDPWTLFCYWEVCPETLEKYREHLDGGTLVLHVVPAAGDEFDVDASGAVGSRYINLPNGGGSWLVLFGVRNRNGSFIALLSSTKMALPPVSICDHEDSLWPGGAGFNAQVFHDLATLPEGLSSLHSPGSRFHDWSSTSLPKRHNR